MARMADTLDALSNGRFVVGLGLGWNAAEHTAAGIAFPSPADRARRLQRTIEHIRCEMGERRVRILVGGSGVRSTLPIVARYADEWNITTASPTDFAAASARLDVLCREMGRDPGEIERSAAMGVLVGRDVFDLRERAERMRRYVPPLASADDVVEAARGMGWLVGTAEDVRLGFARLAECGVERAILGHYDLDGDMPRVLAETCW
jgi:alkanesulfonate monooxygenase SsuD/methylene tetrahydromethanopterin reductase-like flavin-dependent oxidoreductase (luciferase family)